MADYFKTTGATGLMMIRDFGYTIEFWFKAGYTSDWAESLDFNWTANGATTHRAIRYNTGANWALVGSVNVSASQTITFRLLDATGTQGMGGPTTFNQYINRAGVPYPPSVPALYNPTDTTIFVWFADGYDGGSPINGREVSFNTNPSGPWITFPVPGPLTVIGLSPDVDYWFWARTHNALGWSDWSGRSAVMRTLRVPDPPTTPALYNPTMTSIYAWFGHGAYDGGTPIISKQIGYGTNPSGATTIINVGGPTTVENLAPGTEHYFWARTRNAIGWSDWSGRSSMSTIAGARIKVGSTWKTAVPYVKVGGIWKPAEPWVRSVGVWKNVN